jgi:hypothetical protein
MPGISANQIWFLRGRGHECCRRIRTTPLQDFAALSQG